MRRTLLLAVTLSALAALAVASPSVRLAESDAVESGDVNRFEAVSALSLEAWKAARIDRLESDAERLSAPLPWVAGNNSYSLYWQTVERTWNLWVPSSYTGNQAVTLVLGLHGLGDEAISFATNTNFTNMAEDMGFILIYPQGSTGDIGTGWNAGTCCVDETVDDLGFLTAILQQVNATFRIRQDSIHSMGFSNGGFMTESLGCHLSETFQSIASVSGNTIVVWGAQQSLAACDADFAASTTVGASILHVHGTGDMVVPYTGEPFLGWPTIPDDIAAWAKRNQCPDPPVQTLNVGTFTNQVYQNCSKSGTVQVELVTNAGGQHIWPRVPGTFMVSQYILDFWQRVTPGGIGPASL